MKKAAVFLFSLVCAVLFFGFRASAVPVNSVTETYTQPVGLSFTATAYGDEFLSYSVTKDGYVILRGQDDFWYYTSVSACRESGIEADKLQTAGFRYGLDPVPPTALTVDDLGDYDHLSYARTIHDQAMGASAYSDDTPGKFLGDQSVLSIRVNFTDKKLEYSDSEWHDLIFTKSGNSVWDYYQEVSRPQPGGESKINLVPGSAGEMQGDSSDAGVVHIDVPVVHPTDTSFEAIRSLIIQNVIPALEQQNVIDFSRYDKNGDGIIQSEEVHLLFVLAGMNRANDNSPRDAIQGQHWSFREKGSQFLSGTKINNKQLDEYMIVGEKNSKGNQGNNICELGTICHELGHDMGLPDLYDAPEIRMTTDYPHSAGIGNYGLMGSGSWGGTNPEDTQDAGLTPSHFCAYSKVKLGIVEPITCNYLMGTQSYTLYSFLNNAGYNVLKIPTNEPNEYFLLENRQLEKFDVGLGADYPGGIAIWHINESYGRNNCYGQRLVDLEEADEPAPGESPMDKGNPPFEVRRKDGLFRAGDYASFGPSTQPSNRLDSGKNANFSLTVLSASGSAMQVKLETWMEEQALDEGLYRFKSLHSESITLYYMAMQSSEYGPFLTTRPAMSDNQINWFVTAYGSGEERYNRISPFACPDLYLCCENGRFYLSEFSGDPCQLWRVYTFDNKKYMKPINQDNYICIGETTLNVSNTPEKSALSILLQTGPVDAKKEENQRITGNLRFATEDGAVHLDTGPSASTRTDGRSQIWYVQQADLNSSYCTVAPAEQPDMRLTYDGRSGAVLEAQNEYNNNQQWCLCRIDGRLQLRPKTDWRRALCLTGNSLCVAEVGDGTAGGLFLSYAYAADVSEGGRFYFDYRLEGQVLDANNFGTAGAAVQKYPFNGAGNQRWQVVQVTGDSCIILPEYNTQLALGVEKSTNRVALCPRGSSDYRIQWKIETRGRTCRIVPYHNSGSYLAVSGNTACLAPVYSGVGCDWVAKDIVVEDRVNTLPEGAYRLRNVGSSLLLHGNGSINDHHLYQESENYGQLNTQVWLIERTDDSYYCLRSAHDPKVCVTYDQALARCTLVAYTGSDNQKWSTLQEVGTTGFRFILKSMPGHALVVYGASTAPYADLTVFGDNGTDNGKWIPELTLPQRTLADQTCLLSNRNSGLVMDAQNFSIEEGTRILQWSKNYGTNQRWIIQWETDGYYRLSPVYAPDMYLSAAGDGKARLTYEKDGDNAKWLILADSTDGRNFRLTPKSRPGQVAVVQYASKNQGEEIILYEDNGSSNGYWSCIDPPMALPFSMYRIRNDHAGLYLGAASSTGPAQGVTLDQSYAFEMWAVYAGDGFYRFSPYKYGCTLKALSDGVTVLLGEEFPADPDAGLWFVGADGRMHSKKYPGKVLALQSDGTAAGTPIVLVEEHTAQSEVWSFEALSSSRESQ